MGFDSIHHQDKVENIKEHAEIDAAIADIGSCFTLSSCLYIEKFMKENKELKSDRRSLKSKLKHSVHIFKKSKVEIENIKLEIDNYKKRDVVQSQWLQIEKTKNQMADLKMQILTEDYESLLKDHQHLKDNINKSSGININNQPEAKSKKENTENALSNNVMENTVDLHDKEKSHVEKRKSTKELEKMDRRISLRFDAYEVKDDATNSFEKACNDSLAKLGSYMSTIENSLEMEIKEEDDADTLEVGSNDLYFNLGEENKECNCEQIMKNKVSNHMSSCEQLSVLENSEILEIVADVSSQFTVSSCRFVEKLMKENAKLKTKQKLTISKIKRIKHDFYRAKCELEERQREFDLQKKRDKFESRLSYIDKTKNSMVNMKLQVLLDDATEENDLLRNSVNKANGPIRKDESVQSGKLGKESNSDFLPIQNMKIDEDEELRLSNVDLATSVENIDFGERSLDFKNHRSHLPSIDERSFASLCNSSMRELDLILMDIEHELNTLDEENDKLDHDVAIEAQEGSFFVLNDAKDVKNNDKMNKVDFSDESSKNNQNNSRKINYRIPFNGYNNPLKLNDLLENADIENIVSDISFKFAFSSLSLAQNEGFVAPCQIHNDNVLLNVHTEEHSHSDPFWVPNFNNNKNASNCNIELKEKLIIGNEIVNRNCSSQNIDDLLEIEEIVADVSSQLATSSGRFIEKLMKENGKLRSKHESTISKAKRTKHEFQRVKRESGATQGEHELHKKILFSYVVMFILVYFYPQRREQFQKQTISKCCVFKHWRENTIHNCSNRYHVKLNKSRREKLI